MTCKQGFLMRVRRDSSLIYNNIIILIIIIIIILYSTVWEMGDGAMEGRRRQAMSACNLSQLGELQSQKPLKGSMNLVEEENSTSICSGGPAALSFFLGKKKKKKMRMEEAWKETNVNAGKAREEEEGELMMNRACLGGGETTMLEEFRAGAGRVIKGGADVMQNDVVYDLSTTLMDAADHDPFHQVSSKIDWFKFQNHHDQMVEIDHSSRSYDHKMSSGSGGGTYSFDHENQMMMMIGGGGVTTAAAAIQSSSSVGHELLAAERKRQFSCEMMEKSIERRQKRMIKNRESAARSRARKQVR